MNRIIVLGFLLLTFLVSFGQEEYKQLTNLPTLYITTEHEAPIISKSDYNSGWITIKSSHPSEEISVPLEIRGNSTWLLRKKPYRIKLNKKASLLNLPATAKN